MSEANKVWNLINGYLNLELDDKGHPVVEQANDQWHANRQENPRSLLEHVISKFKLDSEAFRSISRDEGKLNTTNVYEGVSYSDWNSILNSLADHYSVDLFVMHPTKGFTKLTVDDKVSLKDNMLKAATYGGLVDQLRAYYGNPDANPLVRLGLAALCVGATFLVVSRALKQA
jgi:hypothetical protein